MTFGALLMNISFSYLATVGFGVTLNIPRKALNVCGLIGILGWMTYKYLYLWHSGMVLASLVAALMIGLFSFIAAKKKQMPMVLFNVPSLVPLVPGGQAYRAVYYFAFKDDEMALRYLVEAGMIAGALALGFFLAELLVQFYYKFSQSHKV